MVIDLTPEQEAHLQRIAEHEGKSPQQFVIDTALSCLDEDEEISRILDERLKEAELGNFIEEDEMEARIEKMLRR